MSENATAFNWRQSSAHLWFLTTFLKPRQPDDFFLGVDWHKNLGEPPAQLIQTFLKLVVLTPAPLNVRVDAQFTRDELRQMCRERGLSPGGKKDELIVRLVAADWTGVNAITQVELYQCSEYFRELAEQYLADPQSILQQPPTTVENENTNPELPTQDKKKVLRYLWEHRMEVFIGGGIVGGVVGNAAYDGLKMLLKEAGELIEDVISNRGTLKPTTLAPGIKLEWCYVPAGYFLMGSADNDPEAHKDEKPQHRVHLDAFYLGKYPITNAQYRVFVQKTGYRQPFHWKDGFPYNKANHPVVYVGWSDAMAFCEWAARATGKPIRLLTEAEWEKGARGTDGRIYPWGNTWQPAYCNTEASGIKDTTPVDRYPRGKSPYGAYDMIGNVWEWTSTMYKSYPYKANDGREKADFSRSHILRGGSWWTTKSAARAACRYHHNDVWPDGGFRVGVAAPFSFL